MFGDTPLIIIEDRDTLVNVVNELRTRRVVGVDTEADSFHHYQEKLCLVQMSDLERDYIIDPLAVGDISPIGALLEDPGIVKIFHGADYDIVCLKRDFGFSIKNIFDTMVAGQFLGFRGVGLADLIRRYFGHIIDKKYQRHDWAARPLEEEHLDYARGDTHFLLALREVLTHKLGQAGLLQAVREECEFLENREWSGRVRGAADFLRVKHAGHLDEAGQRVLRAVWTFRDEEARRSDRPAFKVLPEEVLLALAERRPTDHDALDNVLRKGGAASRKYGHGLLGAVKAGLADTTPLPERTRERDGSTPRDGAKVELLLGPLKIWRNQVVADGHLNPAVVVSNGLLKEIARAAPTTLEALAQVEGMRKWQLERYGAQLLEVVAAHQPASGKPKKRRRKRRGDGLTDPTSDGPTSDGPSSDASTGEPLDGRDAGEGNDTGEGNDPE